ncbi:NAD(P)H-hydrate epimerase [Salinibacillus kushneri]|uniref:Bifunctional NAD(P)H-hydrate repair enzyme n=1 Tax=Salinibacillus kushneri TaxID=237682 RepID=A0A1I0DPQ6_9BACI|nr:NAD(P)H-hydrate dehydratase [Salinibacillus kushneri]SET34532.1 NAD(P)H-hydrate epimerase [Salinibacillus kushneri]
MYIAGQKEMQQMDHYTINNLGLPGSVLMENAGAKVVDEIKHESPKQSKILVLAGSGNNGGDGFVVARRLFDLGYDVLLCLMVNPDRIKGDAKIHFDVYVNRKLPLLYFSETSIDTLTYKIKQADVIVDAILGTGLHGPVRKPLNEVISSVNECADDKMIVAVDIPSGVSGDTGKVEGEAIKAKKTITFVCPKKGFFLNQGPEYIGDWKAVDISVPISNAEKLELDLPSVITKELVKDSIPARPANGHKGTFGHVLVIGGSSSFIGAPIFTAKAALHSGAGLVTLAIPESIYPIVASQNPESLLMPLPDDHGYINQSAIDRLSNQLETFDTIAIGPGMGRIPNGEQWMASFIRKLDNQQLVVDADALFLLRHHLDNMGNLKGNVVLTPHPGEMARLLNTNVQEVEESRLDIAATFAPKYNLYLLLKGHRSIISTPENEIWINPYGHDALSKGGSGDVLTGLVASLLAQESKPQNALIAATYLHAKAGETQAEKWSRHGVTPWELITGIKEEINRISGD